MLQNPVHLDATLSAFLQICSGLFWTITYLLILRRGYQDKLYGMPMVALCANLAWEFIFSFVYPHPLPQLYIDYLWLLFDLGIMVQYLYYGRQEFPQNLPRNLFYLTFGFTLVFSGLLITAMAQEFKDFIGIYAAFAQNLMMSVLFVRMLLKRGSSAGQSVYIALSKMVGTMFPSVLFYLYFPDSFLLLLLFIGIFILDLVYFLLLYHRMKLEGLSPWRKV
ncbi:hypothetical protein ACD591_17270 [Rufibacter glacialis]|uniref:PQ-loop repeat-containing protein n=1 Tax=Rufibacter glacialis TaxID=1259555 RepID=A0A5M8QH78_9BACT|nr:hypothetical protein [Rufibacter glacialis]KAA6434334.1 hypothetical protein FOE74_09005 [Rufibacter glacialis]GGK68637.1 hypothetical protein GCM10011405_15940 [Rufibacter glacialis]